MALSPAYHYTSLKSYEDDSNIAITRPTTHFRLLTLDAGEASDVVSCSLMQYALESAPDYEAISYVWGDPTDTTDIICSGQQLAVTKSLYSALCRFRCASQKRTVWADAICINQGDLEERSAQVSIMGKIYSQARQVLIWLGEESDHESEALNVVSQIDMISPAPDATMGDRHATNTPDAFYRTITSIPQSSWEHLACLLGKPWFQRIWIVQEVFAAQSAQLFNGSKSFPWPIFAKVIEIIIVHQASTILTTSELAVSSLKNILFMRPENLRIQRPMFKLLCATRNFKSTDPRDKLYALSGLACSDSNPLVEADYSIDVSIVFSRYTKTELISGSLAHLSATDYVDDIAQVVLPTWVPDWSRPVERSPFEALEDIAVNAGGASVVHLSVSSNNDLLKIKGKKVSCVDRLGTTRYSEIATVLITHSHTESEAIDPAKMNLLTKQWLLNWLRDCHRTAFGDGFLPTREMFSSERYRRFCQALCVTHYRAVASLLLETTIDRLCKFFMLLTRSLELQSRAERLVDQDESEIISLVFDLDRHVTLLTYSQLFCSDDSGRLAWVPRRTQPGDIFCVFLGAKVPHLLRPIADGRYKLVGECYLHDCMNGEVMEADQYPIEEFVLL